jgi:2-methylcitrate dehydratase PrpD
MKENGTSNMSVIEGVSSYISTSGEADLPAEVIRKAKHHILDSLAASVSGSTLKPGRLAMKYAEAQAGTREAQVAGSPIVTSAVNAALVNGMMAHADETDDADPICMLHPGCAIVPAAFAMAEKVGADGLCFLKAVVLGYDIGGRINYSIGTENMRRLHRSETSIGCGFGAAAAASSVARLNKEQTKYVLSYTAQQTSGLFYWYRDYEHIEKAFVFGGMPARNGVTAATFVQTGFTGVSDPFSGEHNFFDAFSPDPKPELMLKGLGNQFQIMLTTIKHYPVGLPVQAPLDALMILMEKNGLTAKDVHSVTAFLPSNVAHIVDNRTMPDVNLQYILAVTLLDGDLTFGAAHSYERMNDPAVVDVKNRVTLVADAELGAAEIPRQGIVEVITKDGAKLREHVISARGSAGNPMTTEEVAEKCRKLLMPVLGTNGSQELIDGIWNLEKVKNVRELNISSGKEG